MFNWFKKKVVTIVEEVIDRRISEVELEIDTDLAAESPFWDSSKKKTPKDEQNTQGGSSLRGPKGDRGPQGIQGPKGEDGMTAHIHIAYAKSKDGKVGFSSVEPLGRNYMGVYTDFTAVDSQDPTHYQWTLIKGNSDDKPEFKNSFTSELTNELSQREGVKTIGIGLGESVKINISDGGSHDFNGPAVILINQD